MKKLLLGVLALTSLAVLACKSDEESKKEDQQQEQHTDSLRNSVLNSATTDSFFSTDSGAAPVKQETLKKQTHRK